MNVPFLDLQPQLAELETPLRAALNEVLTTSTFVMGPAVARFEAQFAEYIGVKYCVGLNNGTSALHLALLAAGIGSGDEVITTPHSWISTTWAISYVGAKPVFVDIDPVRYTLDPELVRQAITPRTRAILPVHLYGQACDLAPLLALAAEHQLVLIEDAAQAHGAWYQNQRVGSLGHAGCFSFYPGKNLGALGEAGAVVTNNEDWAAHIRSLRDHAQRGRHEHTEVGFNMRMEGVQGAALAVKLTRLDAWNAARRRIAEQYAAGLAGVTGIVLPTCPNSAAHVWHLYVVLSTVLARDEFRARLSEQGIATAVHYPTPIPWQPAYAALGYKRGDFPVAERVMSQCVSLPMYPHLSEAQVQAVIQAVKRAIASSSASSLGGGP